MDPRIDYELLQQILQIPYLENQILALAKMQDVVHIINDNHLEGNPIVFPRRFRRTLRSLMYEYEVDNAIIPRLLKMIRWVVEPFGATAAGKPKRKRRVSKRKVHNGRGSNGYLNGEGLFSSIGERFKILFKGRNETPSSVTKEIEKYGNDAITQLTICKHPIPSAIQAVINKASGGDVVKAMKKANYDKLMHLYLRVVLSSGKSLKLEKNESVSISPASDKSEAVCVPIDLGNKHVTLGELFVNGAKRMGDNFFKYDFQHNNCQHFISSLLTASGLNRNSYNNFIMQDIPTVLKGLPSWAKALGHFFTNAADRVKGFIFGKGVDGSNVQSVLFSKEKWMMNDAKNWLKQNGFKIGKIHETKMYLRFRQYSPDRNARHRTKSLSNAVKLILEF